MRIDLREKQNLRKVPTGTIVISEKGFEFELMSRDGDGRESWKDTTSGLVWHDRESEDYNHRQAVEKFGDKLPTIEEFTEGEKHGFRDVLPNIKYWFWSASLSSDSTGYARVFFGGYGCSVSYFWGGHESVRCVGR